MDQKLKRKCLESIRKEGFNLTETTNALEFTESGKKIAEAYSINGMWVILTAEKYDWCNDIVAVGIEQKRLCVLAFDYKQGFRVIPISK